VLSEWDVSKAYPLVGIGFAITLVIGYIAGENINISRAIGVGLICAGVFMVGGN
jgi:multidrug transporter EmrE-like cation transporter